MNNMKKTYITPNISVFGNRVRKQLIVCKWRNTKQT